MVKYDEFLENRDLLCCAAENLIHRIHPYVSHYFLCAPRISSIFIQFIAIKKHGNKRKWKNGEDRFTL